jgi:hypothetical protein
MGRSESKKVVNQGTAQSAQDQANAQASLAATNKSLGDYSTGLKSFLNFGRQTYGAGGEYQRDQNTIANTTAAAGQTNLTGNLALNSMRTGENTSGYAGTAAESQRQSSKDLTNQLATADTNRLGQLTNLEQFGVQASALPASVQAGLYGTGTSGAVGNLGPASSAAQTKGFWDEFAPALAQGAGTAIGGACACEGAMIRMADETNKPVEALKADDYVFAMSFSVPPNRIIETPRLSKQSCYEIVTARGLRHRGSNTHTVALAAGGYEYMPDLMGKVILCGTGTDRVVEVNDIGKQTVYVLSVGGSHCYQADGIWILA